MAQENPRFVQSETESGAKTYGQIVSAARNSLGISQREAAHMAKMSQRYLSQIENDYPDAQNPGYPIHIGLASTLGLGINFNLDQHEQKAFILPQALQIYNALYPEEIIIMTESLRTNFNIEQADFDLTYIAYSPSFARIGNRIRKLRLNNQDHPSQRAIARGAGITQGYLSGLEKGTKRNDCNNPTMEKLRSIALTLDIDIYELLEIKEVQYPREVACLDRFFRSHEVPPIAKRKLVKLVKAMEAISK